MKIPVRNLWLLQLFASDIYRHHGDELAGAEKLPEELPQLVAQMLADEVTTRLHAGLSSGFQRSSANLRRVRGRIDVFETERNLLLEQGMVRCHFDEIVTDTPGNRLVKTALMRASLLLPDNRISRSLALQLEAAGVKGSPPPPHAVRSMRRQRLLARDHRMLSLAELLLTMSIPNPDEEEFITVAPDDSDQYLRDLFERAVFGFYLHTLKPHGWSVRHSQKLKWSIDDQSEGMGASLPGMETDITLREPLTENDVFQRRVVIDTKFTAVTRAARFREASLKSEHIYQIYAYLMSQHDLSTEHGAAEGLMLHPVVDGHFDQDVVIQGHRIRFFTVDLRASPETIARHLRSATSRRDANSEVGETP